MFHSIRIRLLLWSAAVLIAVVSGFGTLLFYEVKAARFTDIDSHLDTAASALDATLRLFPPNELSNDFPHAGPGNRRGGPPPDGRQKGRGPDGPGGPGRRPDGQRPPPGQEFELPFRPEGPRPQFGPDGERMGDRPPFPMRERFLDQLVLPRNADTGDSASYFNIWRSDGKILKTYGIEDERAKPETNVNRKLESVGTNRELTVIGPHESVIVVGQSISKVRADLAKLRWQICATGVAVLLIGLLGTWMVSRRVFQPVATISQTAARITADNLSERIDDSKIDVELGELARTLNGTFDRIEAAFERQARFTADASHELRTPLSIIRSQSELALLRDRTAEEYKSALTSCHTSAVRMTDLVERLLALARADAGWPGLMHEPVEFDRLVQELIDQIKPLAEKKGLSLKARLKPAQIMGDAALLTQLINNLIMNAMTYNKPEGKIRVSVDPVEGGVSFIVADTGFGISPADCDRLFERFYRVDKSRTRAVGGTGLGLSICKSIVVAHGGWIDVKSIEGKGSEFRVWFPSEKVKSGSQELPKHVELNLSGPFSPLQTS